MFQDFRDKNLLYEFETEGGGIQNIGVNVNRRNIPNVFQPFPKQALVFTCLQCKAFENTVGKGEIARYEQFILFPQCFLPPRMIFCHFHQI